MNDFVLKIIGSPIGKVSIFSAGQAGYIVKSKSGQLLGIDLYLSECVERVEGHIGFKRLLPKILSPYDLEFDCIIATHTHYDHFDMDSIPQLMSNNKTKLFASVNCEEEVQRLKMLNDNVAYVKPGDVIECGDFGLSFVACDHGASAPDAVGVIISVDGKKIFEVGDSCLRLDLIDEFSKYGPFDVLIAPINGAYGNLNERECAILANALEPKLTIPSHYGMFASHGGNPGLFHKIMTDEYPHNPYLIMSMGEKLTLDN